MTDADLVLGILDPDRFLGGRLRLDRDAAERALDEHVARPLGMSALDAAAGIKRIVDSRMADLIRTVTLERGHDPRDFVLYAFGGAGPTHAPTFALALVETIVVPATQSVHSAVGAIASDLHVVCELSEPMRVPRDGAPDTARVSQILAGLGARARKLLVAQGAGEDELDLTHWVEMRYARQTKELRVPASTPDGLIATFERQYARRYGSESVPQGVGIELVTFSAEARGRLPRPDFRRIRAGGADAAAAQIGRRAALDATAGGLVPTKIYDGDALEPGNRIDGPAIVEFYGTTVALGCGQTAVVDDLLNVVIRKSEK